MNIIFCAFRISFVLVNFALYAQVSNDAADHAVALPVDGTLHRSSTTNCTLDFNCLNQALTAKCLVYHNDQWFTFTTGEQAEYYLLVQNQNCRDVNGVQVVVFDGTLCEPSTYSLVSCISLSTQDDVYMTLKDLKSNHTYLINLDGYLNDHCAFDIRISSILPDFAIISTEYQVEVSLQMKNDSVYFHWKLDENLQKLGITEFEIIRRFKTEKKAQSIATIGVERTVKGDYKEEYNYSDTIKKAGTYSYKIIGKRTDGKKYLIKEQDLNYKPVNTQILKPQLHFKNHTEIIVEIFDADIKQQFGSSEFEGNKKEKLLMSYTTTYFEKAPFSIDMAPYIERGINKVRVVISDSKRKVSEEFLFSR